VADEVPLDVTRQQRGLVKQLLQAQPPEGSHDGGLVSHRGLGSQLAVHAWLAAILWLRWWEPLHLLAA
jgi:hypothetical protein